MGNSAYELAHAWQATEQFPPSVASALATGSFGQLELILALPEHNVADSSAQVVAEGMRSLPFQSWTPQLATPAEHRA